MEDTAFKLWQEWFAAEGDPVVFCDYDHAVYCFFCGNDNPVTYGHDPNCIYLRAKTLVHGPLFAGLSIVALPKDDGT